MAEKTIPDDTQQILTAISRFLKEYRLQSGYSQQQLAVMSGIHYNTIYHLESGKNFNIMTLIEICLTLDLPLKEVFLEL